MTRLLQDPRVSATIDFKDGDGNTALHYACIYYPGKKKKPAMVRHLLQAGANPTLTNKQRLAPLALLQQQWPSHRGAIALLEKAPDAESLASGQGSPSLCRIC